MTAHLHPVQRPAQHPTRYLAAASFEQALEALAAAPQGSARPIAGGTDLLLEIERGARTGIDLLIDLTGIPGASNITIVDGVAHLGPLATHNDVVAHPLLVAGALPLAQACWEVGSPQLRNRATIAGNIATASPANDTISALLALGASVRLRSQAGERVVQLADLFTGLRTTTIAADELIVGIDVPLLGDHQRGIYVKLGNRSAQAISVIHLSAVVGFGGDVVTSARIAVGSMAATVVLVPEAAAALVGRPLDTASIETAAAAVSAALTPVGDVRATADYRVATAAIVVRRALQTLANGTQASRWPVAPPLLRPSTGELPPVDAHPGTESGYFDDTTPVTVRVNGDNVTAAGAVTATLLDWLRDRGGLTGTKEGCAEGECGACTVHLNGAAVMACLVPAVAAVGRDVTTVEGLADGDVLHPLQQAFVDCAAVQCGFCTPGFVVAGAALLDECPVPTGDQIVQGLSGNLCRCTGYGSIIAAVERASAAIEAAR